MIAYLLEHNRYLNLLGIGAVLLCALLASSNRGRVSARLIINALALQVILAFLTLKTTLGSTIVGGAAQGITQLYLYAEQGAAFLFGPLIKVQEPWGFLFAFRVLPIIVFFGALTALLFHYGIIQLVARPINGLVYPLLGTSAAETLCAVTNSVLGQTEAPLVIRRYLDKMTPSEILTVMVSGMGTMSGPLFAVYASLGVPLVYLLSASVMAIPATILIAKMLLPETSEPLTRKGLHGVAHDEEKTLFDAIATGTLDGLNVALAVGATLIVFVALIACADGLLGSMSKLLQSYGWQIPTLTLGRVLGVIFAPIGWLLGLGSELFKAGELIGIKLSVNEMVAYTTMMSMHLSTRAIALLSFALCGFANFSSIGIQVAGIGALAPGQRKLLSRLGLKAVLGGTLANLLSAFIAGLML
jgi:concentrative nucleoside transporter, CNT family